MNTKNLLLLASLVFAMPLSAQSPLEDFKRDITLSGSNYVAYRGPEKQLTPAPKGYKPFYLSHYGRHGSRYMIGKQAYDVPYFSLLKAKQEGKLTAKGEETLAKVKLIREEAKGRDGELTPLGALQHQGITKRMMERFPEIFAGNTNIEARSTVVIRCILSMENGLQQMLRMNPKLHIFHDASEHDMYYMNQGDRYLDSLKNSVGRKVVQEEFSKKHACYSRVMQELSSDSIENSKYHHSYVCEDSNPHIGDTQRTQDQADGFDCQRKYDVLVDDTQTFPGNPHCQGNLGGIVIHQDHVCRFNGCIRTKCSHGDTDVSTGQYRCIVDTITYECQFFLRTLLLQQLLHAAYLVCGKQLTVYLIQF